MSISIPARISGQLLDWLYPRYCLECLCGLAQVPVPVRGGSPLRGGAPQTDDSYLCPNCINRMEFINQADTCPKCGAYLGPYTGGVELCSSCRKYTLRFDRAFAVARYQGLMREVILKFKYGRERCLAGVLGDLLIKTINLVADPIDIIMPVPLHRFRMITRGFNQSELLARIVGKRLKIPVSVGNLIKLKLTPDQAGLNGLARRENLKGVFTVRYPKAITGQNILLIDDVLTTGATASEVSRTLKRSGAGKVFVLTLAHGE